MSDPLTAGLLVTLPVQEFVKSGTEDLTKRFTAEAIAKIPVLWGKIKARLTGKSPKVDEALVKVEGGDSAAIETITKNLDVVLDDDPIFAEELQLLAKDIKAGELRQVGLENVEAGELDAEVDQQVKGQPTANTEQIGATGLKVTGKATIKTKQSIE
ncbi:hypothetical protein [Crocosphaera sp. XPORK-15E]|uniref:hypothetical protein n=1 Tax=Crocosphaera sp. XPORK-15E TaxID=3110247 RepID=UPI002B205E03|nr:hypothetical protein [Crocosphaera sp. XPORK-15E]MEA5536369.1 hypothetical protein [Crocosphaera sp. XPORK-15E]